MEGDPSGMERDEDDVRQRREILWAAKRAEIAQVVDSLGYPIDRGIQEAVVASNMMGLSTSASCEGHATKGSFGAPWIECAAPGEPQDRWVGEEEVYAKIAAKYTVVRGTTVTPEDVRRSEDREAWEESQKLLAGQKETEEYQAWKRRVEELWSRAAALLEDFYRGREALQASRLVVEEGVGNFRIHNGGEDYRINEEELSGGERGALEERLVSYRAEMEKFASFLHDVFLQEEGKIM